MVEAIVRNQREAARGRIAGRSTRRPVAAAYSSRSPTPWRTRGTGELRVLDFGGAAGAHYFDGALARARRVAPVAPRWHVCETAPMAASAQAVLGGEELSFHYSLGALEGMRYDLIYASGSLQYVPDARRTWTGSRSCHTAGWC